MYYESISAMANNLANDSTSCIYMFSVWYHVARKDRQNSNSCRTLRFNMDSDFLSGNNSAAQTSNLASYWRAICAKLGADLY